MHIAVAPAERLARDPTPAGVDLDDVVGVPMTIEHDAAAAEGVRDEAIRSGLDVASLNREHALGMRQVPRLAAVALLEARQHQLRAHRAVAEQRSAPGSHPAVVFTLPAPLAERASA